MDVALCLYGQMRTYEKCLDYLQDNIISEFEPDIFIHTWENQGGKVKKTSSDAGASNGIISEEKLEKRYSPKKVVVESFDPDYYDQINGVVVPEHIKNHQKFHKSMLPLLYKMYSVNKIKKEVEEKKRKKYDVVILTRPDIAFLEPIPDPIMNNPEYLWEFRSDRKRNKRPQRLDDLLIVSSSENIDIYSNLINRLEVYWKKLGLKKADQQKPISCRTTYLLHHHINNSNISVGHGSKFNYLKGSEWYLVRYEYDISFLHLTNIGRLIHILKHGDTGIQFDCNGVESALLIMKRDGATKFIQEFIEWSRRKFA